MVFPKQYFHILEDRKYVLFPSKNLYHIFLHTMEMLVETEEGIEAILTIFFLKFYSIL